MSGIRGSLDDGQPPINYMNKYGDRVSDPTSLGSELSKQY